jgi:hypothetical protein
MTKKAVAFSSKPKPKKERPIPSPNEWVAKAAEGADAAVKLTLRVPTPLHIAFKTRCVQEGISLQDKVQAMIEAYVSTADHPATVRRSANTAVHFCFSQSRPAPAIPDLRR